MQYEIVGAPFSAVICQLDAGEAMKTEKGSMVWMDPVMKMETSGVGGMKKALGRAFSGESVFQNIYTAQAPGKIAFGASFPGRILPLQIDANHSFIVQKMSFLAAQMSVDLSVVFRKKLGSGFFSGEGFIMQKLSGQGLAFIECDGDLVEYDLETGQSLLVDTGNVLGFSEGVQMDIDQIKGAKNIMFGGEGLFNTKLTGPGRVWLQTMPVTGLIDMIAANMPSS